MGCGRCGFAVLGDAIRRRLSAWLTAHIEDQATLDEARKFLLPGRSSDQDKLAAHLAQFLGAEAEKEELGNGSVAYRKGKEVMARPGRGCGSN